MNLECMDLRKARCLVLKECDDSIKNLHVETGPMLMIDCPPYSMYFIMTSPRETKVCFIIVNFILCNLFEENVVNFYILMLHKLRILCVLQLLNKKYCVEGKN